MNSLGHFSDGRCPQFGSGSRGFGMAETADATADAVAGASETSEMSYGGVLDKGGVHSVNFTTLSVSFSASGLTIMTAVGVGVPADKAGDRCIGVWNVR
jgi:hypothetical protein